MRTKEQPPAGQLLNMPLAESLASLSTSSHGDDSAAGWLVSENMSCVDPFFRLYLGQLDVEVALRPNTPFFSHVCPLVAGNETSCQTHRL